jgi:hypothetical protein
MRALQIEGVRCSCSRYILHQAITQDAVTRSVAVTSQSCRSNLVVSIAQDKMCSILVHHAGERTGRVTCHHGFHLHGLKSQRCMRTRRVYYDHDFEFWSYGAPHQLTLVVRRNLGRCAHEPQEGFVVAKLLVGTPTPAGGSVSECISIRHAYRRNIGETINLKFLMMKCIFCSRAVVACVNYIRRRDGQLQGVCLPSCLHNQTSGCTDPSIPPSEAPYFR